MDLPPERCPHCDQGYPANKMEEHVSTAHADIPPCTATLDNETTGGTLHCVWRAGHRPRHGEYGEWHVSQHKPGYAKMVWNDNAAGATPHGASA